MTRPKRRGRGPVLVVEDDELNQALAVAILTRLGYSTEVAATGRAAVEMVARGAYGAVLLDCQLPEMDGYRATAEIRRREGMARHTPIIAMTAAASREDRERCLAAGMDDYIAKPVSVGEVEAVLACWVGGRAIAPVVSAESVVDHDRLAALGGLDLVGAGSTLATRLVDAFLARVPTDLVDLGAAVDRGDAAAVGHVAHRLRGAAAILGVKTLIGLCEELQVLAGSATLTPARDLVRRLQEEFDRVGTALDAVVPRR